MKPYVYVARKMPESIIHMLEEQCDVSMWEKEDEPVPREVLEKEIKKADGLFCTVTEEIDQDLIDKAESLKIIATMAVGYNNINVQAAARREIMVANTPGVLSDTTADLTFGLLMATARRIPEGVDSIKNGEWKTWAPFHLIGQDIHGATLGIIGMGRIGEALARRAKGFDMKVLYHNRNRKHETEINLGVRYAELEQLLAESDFVCLMTPYTQETFHLIGKEELKKMKNSAVFINTSRGGTVDEEALYEALKEKEIWAAGLDVFEDEPIGPDHPLLSLQNVVALPHIGSASERTRMRMAEMTTRHILQALSGERPDHLVGG
ncbi:2-hydroxyacid dehydrogenase [Bacillus sp. FJAT-44742]|uniref:2-hydroxyacid dehydrogenase n=1 Tax=Bacillus sp. FJAT-44742 TaxID=2014005 RepID=UPI000C23EFF0|nr:D-glycerate dehydrogenase [Bacillus sp. FJAT-44742]